MIVKTIINIILSITMTTIPNFKLFSQIKFKKEFLFQGTLVPKLTLGPFLTLSVRNGPSVSFGTYFP